MTEPLDTAMDNVLCSLLGQVAATAGNPKRADVGDNIDLGLILLRELEKRGFALTVIPKSRAAAFANPRNIMEPK